MTESHLSASLLKIASFRLESMIGKNSSSEAISLPLVPIEPDFSEYDSSENDWKMQEKKKSQNVFLQCI